MAVTIGNKKYLTEGGPGSGRRPGGGVGSPKISNTLADLRQSMMYGPGPTRPRLNVAKEKFGKGKTSTRGKWKHIEASRGFHKGSIVIHNRRTGETRSVLPYEHGYERYSRLAAKVDKGKK